MKSFESYHPLVLMAYFVAVISLSMFSGHPVILGLALLGGISFNIAIEKATGWLKTLGFFLIFFILITLTNPLFSHKGATVLFFLNSNPVTLESILYGMSIGAMIVGVMYWFKNYSAIMTTDKFLFLFGRFMPRLTLIFSMVLRFIPLFRTQMQKVSDSRKGLGGYLEKGFVARIRSALGVFSIMVTWSLEMAIEMANSMKARGYGINKRSSFSVFLFTKRDFIILILIAILSLTVFVAMALGSLDFSYYPYISNIQMDFSIIIIYICYACLVFLPSIIEIKESIGWKYSISKI